MSWLVRISKVIVVATVALWLVPMCTVAAVQPGMVGVRQSALSGVTEVDLGPGWHWAIPGIHKLIQLPTAYFMLDYTNDDAGPQEPLEIRTKDNNTVDLDVSVPVRIKAGEAHLIVKAGNHIVDTDGRFRYMRLADQTTVSVLREELANLESTGFYSTEQRLAVSKKALDMLNDHLKDLHLEAQAVLIRAVRFQAEYEKQLQSIQLNEQNKLLDNAKQKVATSQQGLDNYQQGTTAQSSAKEQEWVRRQADLERAYQLGLLAADDPSPGAARKKLEAMTPEQVVEVKKQAGEIFGMDPANVGDHYLIGIENIQAETLEYKNRVTAEADGIGARLSAEGDAMVAKVQGEFETKLNALLSSPAGRAYVAWTAAAGITFEKKLTFNSSEGIPSVLRLRRFAEEFMGQ